MGSSLLVLRNDATGPNGFFDRTWTEFQHEFGSLSSQAYWIGLDRLHQVSQRKCSIRFDFQLIDGSLHYAQYSVFSVGNSTTNYTLKIGGYSGDLWDAMVVSNGRQFTTKDVEHDLWLPGNCASYNGGGFWHCSCGYAQITFHPLGWCVDNRLCRNLQWIEVGLLC